MNKRLKEYFYTTDYNFYYHNDGHNINSNYQERVVKKKQEKVIT